MCSQSLAWRRACCRYLMLTKSTTSAQTNKLTASVMPILLSLPAMPTDLACYAYRLCPLCLYCKPEVESSRTSLDSRTSSRTHFQVFGFETSSPRKLPCPRLEDSTISWTVVILLENARNLAENFRRPFFCFSLLEIACKNFSKTFFDWKNFFKTFFWDRLEKIFEDLFFFCVLCPWPWPREGLSLALASKFFCVLGLGLEPCVLDSTSVETKNNPWITALLWDLSNTRHAKY